MTEWARAEGGVTVHKAPFEADHALLSLLVNGTISLVVANDTDFVVAISMARALRGTSTTKGTVCGANGFVAFLDRCSLLSARRV